MSTIGAEYAFLPRKKAKYKVINNKNRKRLQIRIERLYQREERWVSAEAWTGKAEVSNSKH